MNFIIAITGPTGSGKSTIATQIARQVEHCVNIDVDVVKHMIVDGFIYDESPQGIAQWSLLGTNIGQLAKNFHESGYNVVINGYLNEPSWESLQSDVQLDRKFLILPTIETTIKRDQARDIEITMGEEAVKAHTIYFSISPYYSEYTRVDNTDQTVDQTVKLILDQLKENNLIP